MVLGSAAILLAAVGTILLFIAVAPSSSGGDDRTPISSPRVFTREIAPVHVREWHDPWRAVSTNAWRRATADGTKVGVYVKAYGPIDDDARLSVEVAVAEDLADFLTRISSRAPAEVAPLAREAVAIWETDPAESFKCRLDLRSGAVEFVGSRGSVTIDAKEVATVLREAIADAAALARAPQPLSRPPK